MKTLIKEELERTLTRLRASEAAAVSTRSSLIECHEEAMRFAHSESAADPQAVLLFLNNILQASSAAFM